MQNCLLTCSFNLCKIYTYLEQIYKKHCGPCLDYHSNKTMDFNMPFSDYHGNDFYIHTLETKNNTILSTLNTSSSFNQCTYNFLNITVFFNNKEYNIELSNSQWNFYCDNNLLDFDFLHWYMTNVFHEKNFDKSYLCHILDSNYEFIELDSNSYMRLNKDSYEVIYNKY